MKNNVINIYKFLILFILLSLSPAMKGQLMTISGYVSDVHTRETLIGATIQVKGDHKAAITDGNGFFSLAGFRKGEYTLVISHLGYAPEEVDVDLENRGVVLTSIH
ncbi:MAG: carboxypeptidase-like regulatory domain-containing protein, partial [Bacteroidales bacterium]|nr:carboxypeptidase-like regulatory domain-containing protein [Bacteroidales bacterium]